MVFVILMTSMLITVAARYKVWVVFSRSDTKVIGSILTWGTDVCVRLFCVCVDVCVGKGHAMGWSPIQGVLPTVYRLKNWKAAKAQPRDLKPL
jgi:hypothetical protein